MDERLRRLERTIAADADPLAVSRRLRERLRAGAVTQEGLELAAHLGHEAARSALGATADVPKPGEDLFAWWRALARFGREACVRVAIALAREVLFRSLYGRFDGVPEEAWRAVEALDAWVRSPGEETARAITQSVNDALSAREPAGGVGALAAAASVVGTSELGEALSGVAESLSPRYFDLVRPVMRDEVAPWALAERDPIALRVAEEGRHFGIDADIVRSVSFSSDGRLVLSSCRGAITVRSVSGAVVRSFPGHAEVFGAAFSPDASRVLATGQWRPARLLDVATGAELRALDHGDSTNDIAFVDARRALTAGDDAKTKLWDLESGRELLALEGHERAVKRVLVGRDGAITASSDGSVRLWDLETGRERSVLARFPSVEDVAVSADGVRVLVAQDRLIRLLGAEERVFEGHESTVYGVAWLPDGARFLSVAASPRCEARLWDAETGRVLRAWTFFHALPFHVAVAPDGKWFLTGERSGGIRRYEV